MAYCSSYYLYQRYEKRGDQDWIPSYPNVYSIDGEGSKPLRARVMYDSDCGWNPDSEVQNRTLSGTPYCTGYDLYVNETYQVSYDGGVTWETTGNEDVLVERNSAECHYVPPEPIYRWVNITPTSDPNSYWCDDCPGQSYSGQYLTFVAKNSGTFTTPKNVYYSLDSGRTWTYLAASATTPTISAGNKIMWKQTGNNFYNSNSSFTSTGRFDVEGNIMSLLYGDNFQNQTTISGNTYEFNGLFENNANLISAENLVLPATTLDFACYGGMFEGCTSLTTAPQLPATTLADNCYGRMFKDCISLTTPPQLPATTLGANCYYGMFEGCTSLTTAPTLPATSAESGCYSFMFKGCTSLTTAPQLPATTLAHMCYYFMFSGCTSLATPPSVLPARDAVGQANYGGMFSYCSSLASAPVISATTLGDGTCGNMFEKCTSLTTPPVMNATIVGFRSCAWMFTDCTSLRTAPNLPARILAEQCYNGMFLRCSSLNYIKCLATDISAESCTHLWVNGVPSTGGTFVKDCSNNDWSRGQYGIPYDWTVNCEGGSFASEYFTLEALEGGWFEFSGSSSSEFDNSSIQYSTNSGQSWNTLSRGNRITVSSGQKVSFKSSTFGTMIVKGIGRFFSGGRFNVEGNAMSLLYGDNFVGKNDLTNKKYPFQNLFSGNTKVVSAENLVLPATTLSQTCYDSMFKDCTSLTKAPSLPAMTLANNCYEHMFDGCTSLTTAPSLPATAMTYACYARMFANCTSLTTPPQLPAYQLAEHCYNSMFAKCASLTTAPALNATSLVKNCYAYMFQQCTSLTTAPVLPAYQLVDECYLAMFWKCSNLNYVKCPANVISASSCTEQWLLNVASSGTFVKNPYTTWPTGSSGIPSGWSVQNE